MAQFEDYLEKQKTGSSEVFRIDEYRKGLFGEGMEEEQINEDPVFDIEYDPAQLEEKYQNRLRDSTFKERTMYYFEDAGLYSAKAQRYWKLSQSNNRQIEEFAENYTHHSASKRRKAAKAAGKAFGEATLLVQKNLEKEKKAKNDYEIFELREAVMRLRMEGMEKAAEVKSRNELHETFLKCKAKISCLMMLQDQLRNLWKNAKRFNDRAVLRKFTSRAEVLNSELDNAKRKMSAIAGKADTAWLLENDVTGKARVLYGVQPGDQNAQPLMTANQAKTLAVLQQIRAQNQQNTSPLYTLRLDRNNHPMNKAELQKMKWNQKYRQVMAGNDQDAKNEMLMEVVKRVERYKLPNINTFRNENENVLGHFFRHALEYQEMLLKTPDFLNEQMEQNEFLQQYANRNAVFSAKLLLLTSMGRHLRDTMKENSIDPETATLSEQPVIPEMTEEDRRTQISAHYTAYQTTIQAQNANQQAAQEQLSLETEAEQNAEYEQLRQRNPALTKKQYKVYKGIKASLAVVEDQNIWDRFQAIKASYADEAPESPYSKLSEVSRELGMVLRSVHYDKNGRPISEEDKRRAAQNERFIKAWEQHDENTKLSLIMKELPNVFDGFDFPEPGNEEQWFKKNMEERTFDFQEMMTRAISINNMEKRFPMITDFINTHPVFREKLTIMSKLVTLQVQGRQAFYQVKNNSFDAGRVVIVEANTRRDAETLMTGCKETFHDQLVGYQEQYQQSQPILADLEREKQKLRTQNPELTDWEFELMKSIQMSYAVINNKPDYVQKMKNAQESFGQAGERSIEFSRDAGAVLRSVRYNAQGNPLTEEDGLLEAQNNRWIQAWEDGNEQTKEDMALEIVPHMFDDFVLPEPKNLRIWVDSQMRARPFQFLEALRRATALSDLAERIPAVAQYLTEHQEFRVKHTLFCCLNNYVTTYLGVHNIQLNGGNITVRTSRDLDLRKQLFFSLDISATEYQTHYNELMGGHQ